MPSKPRRARGGRDPADQVDAVLLAALAAGATQQEAAARCNVSTDLVRARLASRAFRARLEAAWQEIIDGAVAEGISACTEAMRRIRELMASADEAVALRASVALLEQTAKLRDAAALRRLAELEERLDGKG